MTDKLDKIKYRVHRTCGTCYHFDRHGSKTSGYCSNHDIDVNMLGKCTHGHKLDKDKLTTLVGEFKVWLKE